MKIAFFSKYLPSDHPSGVSVQVHWLACALCRRGHQVTCFSFSARPLDAGYEHVQLPWNTRSRFMGKFSAAMQFARVSTSQFDIVHYHGDDYLSCGSKRRVRTFYGSALFEALHAAKADRFFYQMLFYLFEWLSCFKKGALVAISRATQGALPFVGKIIPCGIPLDAYTPDALSKTSYPSLFFIGDFNSRKRGDLLVKTFVQKVLPFHPAAKLVVVGPERIDAENVICLGQISEADLIREYQKAWIYCSPSSYEGFGVPVIESMACGTVVVACKNRGAQEVIEHNCNGILCSPETLGDALCDVIGDKGKRQRLVKEGLITSHTYSMAGCAEGYERLYEKLVG